MPLALGNPASHKCTKQCCNLYRAVVGVLSVALRIRTPCSLPTSCTACCEAEKAERQLRRIKEKSGSILSCKSWLNPGSSGHLLSPTVGSAALVQIGISCPPDARNRYCVVDLHFEVQFIQHLSVSVDASFTCRVVQEGIVAWPCQSIPRDLCAIPTFRRAYAHWHLALGVQGVQGFLARIALAVEYPREAGCKRSASPPRLAHAFPFPGSPSHGARQPAAQPVPQMESCRRLPQRHNFRWLRAKGAYREEGGFPGELPSKSWLRFWFLFFTGWYGTHLPVFQVSFHAAPCLNIWPVLQLSCDVHDKLI